MSEAIPGVEFEPPPVRVRDAAVVVLVRGDGPGLEVFWVRRGERLAFSGGFYAFPGGSVDRADREAAVSGCPAADAPLLACAIRETFEEAGVLLVPEARDWPAGRLSALRAELLAGAPFGALLAREGVRLDASGLLPAGRWVTPEVSPIRFDARFYLARVPSGTPASVIPGELSDGAWIAPSAALAQWENGGALLHPPNRHALAVLAGFPVESALPRLRRPPFVGDDHVPDRVEFQRGVQLLPLRTPTLPPYRHTNCWIVGTGELAIIDPGSPWPEEQDRLDAYLHQLIDEGLRPSCVLLTHHHRDHAGGALEAGRRLGVPVLGSAETARRVPGVEGRLAGDGDVIELDGPRPMRLRALLTEGHAAGHLCYQEEGSGAVFAGDMVAGGTTVVIDPPEGDLGIYLASLRRLQELGPGTLYPAHGFPIPDGPATLAEYLEHRELRLRQLREALLAGASELADLVERVYADTPPFLHPVARRSALASLLELQRRGEAAEQGGAWHPRRA
jgi:glyoxylase-like metal-dependent hydrolase (beta-lactamase superfamily II)/8-oxo-dGTP pyrophosphatase MutT (NUDIX family)